jgi:hypothetical protein
MSRSLVDITSDTGSVRLNGSRKLEAHPESWSSTTLVALTGTSITLDLSQGNYFLLTLTANTSISNPTNAQPARKFYVHLIQGSSPWVVTWGDGFRFQGDDPGLTTIDGHATIYTFMWSQDTAVSIEVSRASDVYAP